MSIKNLSDCRTEADIDMSVDADLEQARGLQSAVVLQSKTCSIGHSVEMTGVLIVLEIFFSRIRKETESGLCHAGEMKMFLVLP